MSDYELSEADLESALKLSLVWNFEAVRLAAIARLEGLSLASSRVIQLAHLYDVDHWIAPEIERLALRPESLTLDEAKQIGLETAVEVSTHRDTLSRLSLDIVKEHISAEDMARVRSCISENVREQREKVSPCIEIPKEPAQESLDVEEQKQFQSPSDASEGSENSFIDIEAPSESTPIVHEPVLASRAQIQNVLGKELASTLR